MLEQDKTVIGVESITDEVVKEYNWYINLAQDCIVITEDKIRLWQIKNIKDILGIKDVKAWVNPALILLTIIVTLATSTFNKLLFRPDVWEALFIIGGVVTILWLINSLIRVKGKSRDEGEMLNEQIKELVKESKIIKSGSS